jgi:hypothetical protein
MHIRTIVALAALSVTPACRGSCNGPGNQPAGAAGVLPFAVSGPEVWTIDGKPVRIDSTYYIAFPATGGVQYCIDSSVEGEVPAGNAALNAALPLMKYAVASGAYERTAVSKFGSGAQPVTHVGVAFYRREGGAARGYRVNLPVDEIRKRTGMVELPR